MAKFVARLDTAASNQIQRKLRKLKRPIQTREAKELGKIVLKMMLSLISKGISPIKGGGNDGGKTRFPKYKDVKKYPAKVRKKFSDKGNRPVNLSLSGEFLKSLKVSTFGFFAGRGTKIKITGRKNKLKEDGHRFGAPKKGDQPSRPIIPRGNEKFAKKIQVKILEYLEKQIGFIVKDKR